MTDRPPGHMRDGPAVIPPGRPPDARSSPSQQGSAAASVPPRLAELLDLSDERDLWLRRVLAAWRDGYRAALGDAVVASLLRIWPEPGHVPELDKRRYPPGGRLSWLLTSPACPPAARMTPCKLFRHLGIPAGDGWHQPPAGWREMDAGALAILHDLLHESGDGITIAHTHTHARPGDFPGRQHG